MVARKILAQNRERQRAARHASFERPLADARGSVPAPSTFKARPGYFRIEYLSSKPISFCEPAGCAVGPFSTSLLSTLWPYNSALASASLRDRKSTRLN